MSGAKFTPGDTVRVLESYVLPIRHGKTGTVLGYSHKGGGYARVQFPDEDVDFPAMMLDSELELVTAAPAPVPAMPGLVRTEWGVRTPEWGTSSARDLAAAETIAQNMREAGHDASVVWRGVTEWQSDSSPAAQA